MTRRNFFGPHEQHHTDARGAILMLRMARLEERDEGRKRRIDDALLRLAVESGRRDLIPPALERRARAEGILS